MQGEITGYPASLIAGLIIMGGALVAFAALAAWSGEYRRAWLSHLRRDRWSILASVGLVLIAQPGLRDLGNLTVGEHLMFKLLGMVLLACVAVPSLIHMKNNHPDVWEEVSRSPSGAVSSAAKWVILRYAVVMVLVMAGPLSFLVILFREGK